MIVPVLVLAVATGCCGAAATQRVLHTTGRVPLAPATPTLSSQCATAADTLGFSVPCPSVVPTERGIPMDCPGPQGDQVVPCVGYEGATYYRVFVLQLSGFDVPRGYVGAGARGMGHFVLEARPVIDSPKSPCIGAMRLGSRSLAGRNTSEFTCPSDNLTVEREARHGEGIDAGHLLLEWRVAGVDYTASAHGPTTTNLALLVALVRSIKLVTPRGAGSPAQAQNTVGT